MKVCPVCARPGGAGEGRCPLDGAALVELEATAADARPGDLVGQVIDGRYRIDRVVGKGGMGTVYAARHVVVGREVAVKVLRPAFEHKEETLARFVREAQAANAVRSRHIVRADDFGQLPNGSLYVVMELLEGRSLGAALRERSLGRAQLLRICAEVADALGAAHEAGVVHRDLKPDNVFLTRDERGPDAVRILDFGVAKLSGESNGLTSTGVILGTPNYMSPEQARGHAIDHRADVYALGVVMYQGFTGRLPFVSDSAVGVLTAHAVEEPARPALSGVDVGLEAVILRCMQKRPDDRFSSMHELAAALRAIAGGGVALPAPAVLAHGNPSGAIQPSGAGLQPGTSMSGVLTGVSPAPAPPAGRGLYAALGAGVAVVGVVAALLLMGPGGLLRAAPTSTPSGEAPAVEPVEAAASTPSASAAPTPEAAPPAASASAAPSALPSASVAPVPPQGGVGTPAPWSPATAAPPPPAPSSPSEPPPARTVRPGAPDGIRSPF